MDFKDQLPAWPLSALFALVQILILPTLLTADKKWTHINVCLILTPIETEPMFSFNLFFKIFLLQCRRGQCLPFLP